MSGDSGIERLIRPDLVAFDGYSSRKSPENLEGELEVPLESVIKLDANENPYGCSPRVNQALVSCREMNTYGDAGQHEQSLWGWLAHIPGLSVVVPSNPADAGRLMLTAINADHPVIYLEHKLLGTDRGS